MSANKMKALNLLSGGVAGTIASCITNPLEVVKTQLQSSSVSASSHGELASASGHPMNIARRIFAVDGVMGFFRGLKPTLIGIIPARSIYFYTYNSSKRYLGKYLAPEGSIPNALLAGFSAGIASNTLTNPIWMVKTRYQLLADSSAGQRAYTGYGDAITSIFKEEGIGGFYRGIFASYWGCLEGSIQFILYEQIKRALLLSENKERKLNGLPETDRLAKMQYFWGAAAAKGIASIMTYPHEVARTRLREQARSGVFKYNGIGKLLASLDEKKVDKVYMLEWVYI
eukprot:CAMPEP_0184865432 /NCGR_PEP_ID=MMETSP0580-20130426/18089_1 /TAXON_ID=1118495 /ORGANISM="Dactyliosolen fragilissimus" /LENGTH=284 /DNA_ID=CAMNT_0027364643 /DNA_START=250 /DNA_END=1105 /DNA_ORIENTATION=-